MENTSVGEGERVKIKMWGKKKEGKEKRDLGYFYAINEKVE